VFGVGIDTARYGHRVTFLRPDRQPAAEPLDVPESRAGYERLGQRLAELAAAHPQAKFHVRLDAAGQYAVNLERFLRSLPLPLELSMGEPARNAAYRKAHFPKRKSDASDSLAQARYAVVERPAATSATPPEFMALREVAGRLEAQAKQTVRLKNQLHNLLARVFPELATIVPDVAAGWVLRLLSRYPTPRRLARAKPAHWEAMPYVGAKQAAAIRQAAEQSVGTLGGEIAAVLVRQAVREILSSRRVEVRLQRLLHQAFETLPNGPHRLLTTIPGIGRTTAAALVAKVVSIDRFATPAQLVSYFGVFPEENTSGYDRHGRPVPPGTRQMSRQGSDLVRRLLWMAAQTATLHNPAVRALHARQRARGKRGDVALGHGMRKLLHLVFAVWKTGRPFDPAHYPWQSAAQPMVPTPHRTPALPAQGSFAAENKQAAGHKEDRPPRRKVVTAATSSVASPEAQINTPRRRIDYSALRAQVTIEQALDRLGWLARLKRHGVQLRGPCPVHAKAQDTIRSFSADRRKNVFRCFHPQCAAQGNVLDLWAAVQRLPLYEAAQHLAQTFTLPLPTNREEEPVSSPRHPR
jgi:transposase